MADENDLSDIGTKDNQDLSDLGTPTSSFRNTPYNPKDFDLSDLGTKVPEPKSYFVANGQIHVLPGKEATGMQQAANDGVADKDYVAAHMPDFQRAQVTYNDLEQAAGSAQVAKALLNGAGRGGAFLAAATPGGEAGAAVGAAVVGGPEDPLAALTVPVGAALGSLTTGTIASFAYSKAVDKLADYNDAVRSLAASAQLHPIANAAGELAAFATSAPRSLTKLYQLSQVSKAAAVAQVAKGAAAGAAFEGVVRPGFDVARHLVADQLGTPHEQTQAPSLSSMAQNVALGILTAGHSVEFKDFSGGDVANLTLRAKAREAAGIPLNADDPAAVIHGFQSMGADETADLQKNGLLRPLTPDEIRVYADLQDKMDELRESGQLNQNQVDSLSARIAKVGKTQIAKTQITLRPKAGAQPGESNANTQQAPMEVGSSEQTGPTTQVATGKSGSVQPTAEQGGEEAPPQPVAPTQPPAGPAPAPAGAVVATPPPSPQRSLGSPDQGLLYDAQKHIEDNAITNSVGQIATTPSTDESKAHAIELSKMLQDGDIVETADGQQLTVQRIKGKKSGRESITLLGTSGAPLEGGARNDTDNDGKVIPNTWTVDPSLRSILERSRVIRKQPAGRAPVANPRWQVTVGVGGVQIDSVENGDNQWSKNPQKLRDEGYTVPDFSSLKPGRYTFEEATYMLANPTQPKATPQMGFKPPQSEGQKPDFIADNSHPLGTREWRIANAIPEDWTVTATQNGAWVAESPVTEKNGKWGKLVKTADAKGNGRTMGVAASKPPTEEQAFFGKVPLGISKKQWDEMATLNDYDQVAKYGYSRAMLIEKATTGVMPAPPTPKGKRGASIRERKPGTVAKPPETPTIPVDVDQRTEGESGSVQPGGEQPRTPSEPVAPQPASPDVEQPPAGVQPGVRAEDGGTGSKGGTDGSRIADADANGVPAQPKPEAPLVPSADTGVEGTSGFRGEPTETDPAPAVEVGGVAKPDDIRLTENPAPTGPVERIRANIEALKLVKQLMNETRLETGPEFPTEEQRKVLARWSGWGSFKEMFNDAKAGKPQYNTGWIRRYGKFYDELKSLLTDEEFLAAIESTVNAHYTSQEVVTAMWNLARRLGFKGGKALEPSTGSGVFIGYMPDDLHATTRWMASELEPITGAIFGYLYPNVNLQIMGFQKAKMPAGYFDLAITNVPFHETGPGAEYPTLNLHNYFLARMLDKVRPGGIVLAITSNSTMDRDGQQRHEQRGLLADKCEFVGAIRLPNDAFKGSAGTEVVTDIVVLRKPDGKPFDGQRWRNTKEVPTEDGPTRINEYYADHPEMVLGKNALTGTMYRKDSYTVESTAGALAEKLAKAIEQLPADIMGRREPEKIESVTTKLEEGTIAVDEKGHVLEAHNFQLGSPVSWDGNSPSLVKRAKLYVATRNILKDQYRMESAPESTEADIERNRHKLNEAYKALRRDVQGTLNGSPRKMDFLSSDPDYYTVLALEVTRQQKDPKDADKTITVIEPADVLSKRVMSPDVPPSKADNATDALGISLAYRGGLDMDYIQELTGMSRDAIEAELINNDIAFKDPDTGSVVMSIAYLSGDVREKLAKAIFAAKESQDFQRNVDALKLIIPETIPFSKIRLAIDARWVPASVMNVFASEVLGLAPNSVAFVPGTQEFVVNSDQRLSDTARVNWSNKNMAAPELLYHAMNFKVARITWRDQDGKVHEDTDASALCNKVIADMKRAFDAWVRENTGKVPYQYFDADTGDYVTATLPIWQVLEREFNRTKNGFVKPNHDGSKLKLPGLSNMVLRKQHLLDGVMRAIMDGSVVYGHGVGSGKTFLAIIAMNELRRIGKMKKGVIAVKKPTVDQYRVSIERAYPGKRVLMPSEKDFKPANRKKLAARIASGNWDFIILTHEQLKAIRTSEKSVNDFFNDQIEQLLSILRAMGQEDAADKKSTRGMDPSVRSLVKRIKSLRKRLDNFTTSVAKKQDVGMQWEDLGIDGLWIDESHNFKKMPLSTQMNDVKGIPSDFSQRAVDMLIKIRDIQRKTDGRNVFFASGTPVSNTLAEMWLMLYATNPKLLKDFGIETFDAFATAYADTVTNTELGWDNVFKDVTRMAKFKNAQSLTMLTRLGVDVRMGNKELGLDVPELRGGKPTVKISKVTPSFQRWLNLLDNIVIAWNSLDPKGRFENSWVPIATMRAGVAAALDPRCVFRDAEDDPDSKVNTAVRDIIKEWQDGKDRRTTMMVFADMYRTMNTDKLMGFVGGGVTDTGVGEVEVPEEQTSDETGDTGKQEENAYEAQAVGEFNLYRDIKAKLVAAGIPDNEVAIITDFDNDVKRAQLFNDVRSGRVRVLIGSTEKIGEGVDVPQRMSAMFNLDPPMQMTPAKQEQRNGRGIRQGNLHSPLNWNIPIGLFMYAQEKSMDAAIYQMLETKSIMVLQFLKGNGLGDEFEDPMGELTATMLEMKAAATGDTRVLELAKLQREVRELNLEESAFHRRVSELRSSADSSEQNAQYGRRGAEKYTLLSKAMSAETADKDKTVLTHGSKRYVGAEAIDQFLERARPAFEDKLKKEGEKAQMHLKLGTDINVLISGETRRSRVDQKLHTNYEAVFYIGSELNHGVPQWRSSLNSIESLMTAANGVPKNAQNHALDHTKAAETNERLAKQYAETFAKTKFENADLLKTKRARLYELETELRAEGKQKTAKATTSEVQVVDVDDPTPAPTADPPIEDRIKAQIAELVPQLAKTKDDLDRAKGRMALTAPGTLDHEEAQDDYEHLSDAFHAIDTRIATLERRLAVVVKFKNPNAPVKLPDKPIPPQLSIDPTPTSVGEEHVVRGLQELAGLLRDPNSGLSPEARRVALDLLNTPVMQNLDWSNLTVALKNRMEGGYAGSADVVQNIIEIAKRIGPTGIPHEIGHFLFKMLSAEDKARVEELRKDALANAVNTLTGARLSDMPQEIRQLIEELIPGTMSSDAFVQQLNRLKVEDPLAAEWWASLYPLINPSEFLAGMFGNRFSRDSFESRNQSWWDSFIAKLKSWIRAIMDSLKRVLGLKPDMEQIYREILAGRRTSTPESGQEWETAIHGQPEGEPAENAGVDPTELEIEASQAEDLAVKEGWIKTEVMGNKDYVRGRDVLSSVEIAAGAPYAKKVFDRAGLQVTDDGKGFWKLTDPTFEAEIEGRKLLELLTAEIAIQKQPGSVTGYLGNLLNSVVFNMTQPEVTAFSPELRRELYSVAQGERSQRGLLLASLVGFGKTVDYVARNVDTVLSKVYNDRYGGDEIRRILAQVLTEFRGLFTDDEIKRAIEGDPAFKDTVDRIIAMNTRDESGRVYRRAQQLLKPKKAKKLSRLEADVRVTEAVNEILAQLKRQGIEPKPSPNKPIPPLQRLLLLVKPENAQKVDKLIANAIADAEHNAGIKSALKEALTPEDRQDLLSRFAAGEEPDEDMVEKGLDLPEFRHWKALRDDLLGYSPTTLKVVQSLLRNDFRGVRYRAQMSKKPSDTKIDLNTLAEQPDAEVQRVINAYTKNIDDNMQIQGATDETRLRVVDMIHNEVTQQIERIRAQMRDRALKPTSPRVQTPEDEALQRLINVGVFKDPRMASREMVDRLAARGVLQRLAPNVSKLVKDVFNQPFYRQQELAQRFADEMVDRFQISAEEAETAKQVFLAAFGKKMDAARTSAFNRVAKSLTPQQRLFTRQSKATWRKIMEAVNAGVFDTGIVLQTIAAVHGWHVPKADEIRRMRDLANDIQRLNELSDAEIAEIKAENPETPNVALEEALRDKRAATFERRIALKKKIETLWARMTHPMTFGTAQGRTNIAQAINEFTSANLLFKIGFPPRLAIDIITQGLIHTPTRAIAAAITRYQNDTSAGRTASLWGEINGALRDAYRVRLAAYKANLVSAAQALAGKGDTRNVDRLVSRIAVFERIGLKADELAAKGDTFKASALRLLNLISFSYRVAQTLDNFQGLPAEYQEMRQQVETALRENGMSKAEAVVNADKVIGDMRAEWNLALGRVREIFDANGLTPTANDIKAAAWQVVKSRQYARMKGIGLPADDFQEINRLIRSTVAWAEREDGGLGGYVAAVMRASTEKLARAGLPMPLARFSNAIATGINRSLMFTPLGFFPGAFGDSPWMRTEQDRLQRKIEAGVGTSFGLLFMAMVLGGLVKVWLRPPQDKAERDLWDREGHRANTMEFVLPNGDFIPVSLMIGAGRYVAPYVAAAGAIKDAQDKKAREQAKMNAEAEKKGLPAGTVKPLGAQDYLGAAGWAAYSTLLGGRTSAGLISSFTEQNEVNVSKAISATFSPMIPGLPALQEGSRMDGVVLDPRLAGVMDYMVPLPTSGAAKANVLGDNVGTESAVQRITQILTGGTYPLPVSPSEVHQEAGYQALFDSGFRPPAINVNQGYAIDGEFRPLNKQEMAKYTQLRGQYLKEALSGVTDTNDVTQVRAAYQAANARALHDVGVETTPATSRSSAQSRVRATPPTTIAGSGSSSARANVRPHTTRARVAHRIGHGRSSRGASLRPGRGLRFHSARAVGRGRVRRHTV